MNPVRKRLARASSVLIGLSVAAGVYAANPEPVIVGVEFVDPIDIAENTNLEFGLLDQNLASGETVVIGPDGSVTDAAGNVLGGAQQAADLTVSATVGQPITILVDGVTNNTGYTLGTFMCNYGGAAGDTACDGAGYTETSQASATLLIGATLTGDGNAVPGVADGGFDVTISYQ